VAASGNPFGWGPDRGVYRTKDGGRTWQKVLFINDQTGVVSVAINSSNPNEIYAGAWRAQRKAWTIISGGPASEGGGYKATDGGKTFTTLSPQHGDNHVMWINPDNPKIFIETNDGGANITEDGGRSFSSEMNQPTAEIYMVDADEEFPYRLVGPQQDNSTYAV